MALNFGSTLAALSFWTIPGIYDIGMLSMMGAKKTLKNEYRIRYNEDPDDFGESGDDAYWQGWALKGGAVAALIVGFRVFDEPLLPAFSFVILWLTGTFKHYEASRMLYEQARHYENGILDENPPMLGRFPANDSKAFKLRLALDF